MLFVRSCYGMVCFFFMMLLVVVVVVGGVAPLYRQTTLQTPHTVAAFDGFGTSVSVWGGWVVVGADVGGESRQGVVFLFREKEANGWSFHQRLEVEGGIEGDRFGNSVSLYDNWLAVGAFLEDRVGKVRVYKTNGTDWVLYTQVRPLVHERDGFFGNTVVVTNHTLAVGHPGAYVEHKEESGNVNVFSNWGLNWNLGNVITPAIPRARSLHGFSIDFDRGDEFVVGSLHEETVGKGYIYRFNGARWEEMYKISGLTGDSELGYSVAIDGSHVAFSSRVGGPSKNGYVITVDKIEGAWVPSRVPLSGDVSTTESGTAYFGNTVSIDDGMMAIGSPFEGDTGAVYVYTWLDREGWIFQYKLVGPSSDTNSGYHSRFGWSTAIHNGVLLVGAPGSRTTDGVEKAGTVTIFDQFRFTETPTTSPVVLTFSPTMVGGSPSTTTRSPSTTTTTTTPTDAPTFIETFPLPLSLANVGFERFIFRMNLLLLLLTSVCLS